MGSALGWWIGGLGSQGLWGLGLIGVGLRVRGFGFRLQGLWVQGLVFCFGLGRVIHMGYIGLSWGDLYMYILVGA